MGWDSGGGVGWDSGGGVGWDSGGGVGDPVGVEWGNYSPHKEERTAHTQSEDMPNGLNRKQNHRALSLCSCNAWHVFM